MLLPVDLLMSLSSAVQQREGSAVSAQPSTGVSRTTAAFSWDDEGGDPRALLDSLLASLDEHQGAGFAADFFANLKALGLSDSASGSAPGLTLALGLTPASDTASPASWTADELINMAQRWLTASQSGFALGTSDIDNSGNLGGKGLPGAGQPAASDVLASALAALFRPQLGGASAGDQVTTGMTGTAMAGEDGQASQVLAQLMGSIGITSFDSTDPSAATVLQSMGTGLGGTTSTGIQNAQSSAEALNIDVSQDQLASVQANDKTLMDVNKTGRLGSTDSHVNNGNQSDRPAVSSLTWRSVTGSDMSAASAQVGAGAQMSNGQSAGGVSDFVLAANSPGQVDGADEGKTGRQNTLLDFSASSYGGDVRREQAMQARESFVMPENWQRAGLQWQTQAMNAFGQPQWGEGIGRQLLIMSANGIQSAQIRLDPPELGTLMVKVKMSGEAATINFVSQHAMVRDMLDTQLPRLQEMFREQGLELANASVSDNGTQGSGSGAGESDGEAGRQGKHSERDPMPDEQPMPLARASSLIDYYA